MSVEDDKIYKFLVADDHSLIRQGIIFVIEDLEIDSEIQQAGTLKQVLELVKANTLDVVILDAHFPDGNSLSVIPEIKKISPKTKILLFTGIEENPNSIKYINAGANGYLSKLSEEAVIMEAITKIIEEGEYLTPVTQRLLLDSLRNKAVIDPLSTLSERELQIAKLYAEGMGNLEIANHLDVKQNTVSTIKKRLFEKLKIDNIVELIQIVKEP